MKTAFALFAVLFIFTSTFALRTPRGPNQDILQQLYNGFFEQAGLPDPVTVVNCYDDDSAELTVNFLGSALQYMADLDALAVHRAVKNFEAQAPQALKDCLTSNAEMQTAQKAYGFPSLNLDQLTTKFEYYALEHVNTFKQFAGQANNDYQSGNYNTVGQEGGAFTALVFKSAAGLRSDRDTLQQVFNGFWEQAGLADPQTAVSCFDDNSATQAVNALGNSLSQLANNNVAGAEKTITDFVNTLPQPVKDCLGANSEVQSMLSAYHIAGLTPSQVQSKLVKFLLTHIFSLHKDAVQANSNFQSGNYKPVGTEGGVIAQQVFGNGGSKKLSLKDAKSTLQLLNNGFYEQAGLPDPVTVLNCYDDDSAQLTVNFIGTVLQQMADNQVVAVEKTIKAFQAQLPQAVKDCLNANAEIQTVQRAYGFYGMTLDQIQNKIEAYAFSHLIAFRKAATQANNDFKAGNFVTVGKEGGQLATVIFQQSLLRMRKNLRSDRDTLQQVFNGFWEQAGLSDPQTAVSCFDDNSATQAVNALGNSLSQLANNNVAGAEKTITDFVNTLPQPVKDCLGANSEVQSMLSAYHIAGLTPSQVQSKLVKFLLTHIFSLHKDAVQANSNFQSGNYKPVGTEGGVIAQQVFGNGGSKKLSLKDAQSALQDLYNGYFEQASLPDPTTILSCYDDDTAQLTVNFIGSVLVQMANNMVIAVEKTIKAYQSQVPQAVKDCLAANAELQQVEKTYGYAGLTLILIQARIEAYAISHLQAFHAASVQANNDFKFGNFKTVGQEGGQLAQQVFGKGGKLGSDADTLQGIFTGAFNQVGLPVPTTVISCFDSNSLPLTNSALGTILDQVSHADFTNAGNTMRNYFNTLPSSVTDCLQQNGEYIQFLRKYHLSTLTITQFQAKVAEYAVLHRQQLVTLDNIANQYWINAKFASTGQEIGVILQQIFGSGKLIKKLGSDADTLQGIFTGAFNQVGLTVPTTVISCFDSNTLPLTNSALGTILDQVSHADFVNAGNTMRNYFNTLPSSVTDCLQQNGEYIQFLRKYHLSTLTITQFQAKVAEYAVLHRQQLVTLDNIANQYWTNGKFASAGQEIGVILQQIFGSGKLIKKLGSDADTLQGIFTGAFNQVGLTVPTTVISCFDSNTLPLTNSALGTVLDQVSHADFVNAGNTMRNYFNTLPSSVTDCLQQNGEYIQFLRKYHLSTLTITQFQAKVAEYAVLHRQQLVTLDNIANQYWISAKFASAGQEIGVILQQIFGASTLRDQDPKVTLQQYLNGYFEYVKLEDPTTIVSSCFNDDTATLVNNLIANLVDELANNKVLVAEKTALDFIKTCPPALKACVFSNPESVEVIKAYKLNGYTPPTAVAKVVAYALTHAAQFTGTMVTADQAIQLQEYASAGQVFGQVTQLVFGKSSVEKYLRGRF